MGRERSRAPAWTRELPELPAAPTAVHMPLRGAARCAAQRGALGRLGGAVRGAASIRQRVPGRGWRTIAPATSGHGVSIGELTREAAVPNVAASNPMMSTETDADAQLRQIFPLPLAVCPGFTLWAVRTVLPHGFPTSVSGNYLRYVRWTTLGLLSGRVQSVLATQAALVAVGLGAGAIPVAATVQWILKDGVGHLAAIGYASAVNTRFDADARRFRYQSTCALSIADFIAAAMPLWPHHFLLLASISSATKSIASIAQARARPLPCTHRRGPRRRGAPPRAARAQVSARARIMASFARRGNLADVTRAGQTQSKLASLIGTGLGAGLAWVVGSTPTDVFCCMVPLSWLSLYAMHRWACPHADSRANAPPALGEPSLPSSRRPRGAGRRARSYCARSRCRAPSTSSTLSCEISRRRRRRRRILGGSALRGRRPAGRARRHRLR